MGMEQDIIKFIMPFADKKQGIVFDGKVTNTVKDLFMSEYSKLQIGCMTGGKTDETLFWKHGNNSYYTYDFIAGRVCRIFNQ